jgi:hypothetical protein
MKSTHWTAFADPDEWPDDPAPTIEGAAEQWLDESFLSAPEVITLHGFRETTKTPEEENCNGFDLYEPGQPWFISTGETKRVRLSLKVEEV